MKIFFKIIDEELLKKMNWEKCTTETKKIKWIKNKLNKNKIE